VIGGASFLSGIWEKRLSFLEIMKFIDEASIYVKGGSGGRGCVSFRREKHVPRGGPDGGDGGKGGDVVVRASKFCSTLLDLKYRQHYLALHGGHGEGNNRKGRNAPDVIITVPVGTVVTDAQTGELLADLDADGATVVVARGGRGGKGNAFFVTATNRAPRFAQEGEPGEERKIHLELKLLAEVGLVGRPNVGKSTFLSRISSARPKIADYPFTTLRPHLGVVDLGEGKSMVVADIPGLIENAHLGAGMGISFLKHIERTSVLFHILDISRERNTDAWGDFEMINNELVKYSPELGLKPQIVGINKIDLPIVRERMEREVDVFEKKGIPVYTFSAVTGEGVAEVIKAISRKLEGE